MKKLTEKERELVEKLKDPLYTVEYLEIWINNNDNAAINIVTALNACFAKGYYQAVQRMVELNK